MRPRPLLPEQLTAAAKVTPPRLMRQVTEHLAAIAARGWLGLPGLR